MALNLFIVHSFQILGIFQNSRTYSQFKKSDFGISIKVSIMLYVYLLVYTLPCIVLTRKLGNVGLKVQRLQESKWTYRIIHSLMKIKLTLDNFVSLLGRAKVNPTLITYTRKLLYLCVCVCMYVAIHCPHAHHVSMHACAHIM